MHEAHSPDALRQSAGVCPSSSIHQSEAIANLRESLSDHQPISTRFSRRAQRRRHRRSQVGSRRGQAWQFWQMPGWTWSPLMLVGLMLSGGMGMLALQWLLQPPPIPNCRALSPLAAPAKRLHCAQQLASSATPDHLMASIATVKDWGPGHPLHQEAQSLLETWSNALLEQAEVVLHTAGLAPAVDLASAIPSSSPVHEQAQADIKAWRQQWEEGEVIQRGAIAALGKQDWKQVEQSIGQLGQLASPYWHQKRADALSLRLVNEQQGRRALTEAEAMAEAGGPTATAEALTHLASISPNTAAYAAAEPLRQSWSDTVVDAAKAALRNGDQGLAVRLAQAVPPGTINSYGRDAAIADLLYYSHAQRLAAQAQQPAQWWLINEAIAAARAISAGSEFAEQIQPQLQSWQTQREQMAQLQLAQTMAGSGQRWLLQLSVAQAEAIGAAVGDASGAENSADPDPNPQRTYADALITDWQQALTQIAGRPRFLLAQRTAEPGTEAALNAAIDIAQPLVSTGRDWPVVQQALADWRSQIQALEDRPLLVKAQEHAAAGDLWAAITQAEAIGEGRALYPQAQGLITEWQTVRRAAEDRQRLAEAEALAADLSLSRAIEVAGAISPASETYEQAQQAIAQWQQERDAWVARRQAEAERAAAPEPSPPVSSPSAPSSTEPAATEPPSAATPPAPDPAGSSYYGYYGTSE